MRITFVFFQPINQSLSRKLYISILEHDGVVSSKGVQGVIMTSVLFYLLIDVMFIAAADCQPLSKS